MNPIRVTIRQDNVLPDEKNERRHVLGIFQSGQMGQTVNLLAFAFGGSNPSPPTSLISGNSSVDRALAFQAGGRGFEPRLPLTERDNTNDNRCCFSSVVERILGKDEVPSSTLGSSSTGYWFD